MIHAETPMTGLSRNWNEMTGSLSQSDVTADGPTYNRRSF